jgi:hypothetical protein
MAVDRKLVVPLVEKYFPKDGTLVAPGKIGIDHICKDWLGGGTTCGFLPHWLLWKLGCKDGAVVNRYEPDSIFAYKDQVNLGRFYSHKLFTKVAFPGNPKGPNDDLFLERKIYPKTGDAVIIQGNKSPKGYDTSHIFILLDDGIWDPKVKGKGTWRVAETGQGTGGGSGHIANRGVEFKNGKWWVNAEGKSADKWMLGWFDISKLEFGPPLKNQDYLNTLAGASTGDSKKLFGRWDVTSSNGEKWIYYFFKGFRCFYAYPSNPGELIGEGHWYPNGNEYVIHWNLYAAETVSKVTTTTATGTDSFGQWTAKKASMGQNTKFRSKIAV